LTIDNLFLLVFTSLPVLFYVFAFKNLDKKKADLIVFIACILFVIPYLLSIILYAESYPIPMAILYFPIFQILLCVSLGLKFYSLDIFNKFNGKLILKILVTLLIIFTLIRFVLSLFTVGIIAEYLGVSYVLLGIISSVAVISFWALYLIMLNDGKLMLFSKTSNIVKNNLSFDDEKSKYNRNHPSNW
tara:strand:- start:143 stop:706 length:564 start_codon:yes stop_codon:yes gene_type:complete